MALAPDVGHVPAPAPADLLPPLMAALATARGQSQPPPALLSLLTPILRCRIQFMSGPDWLSLLTWDRNISPGSAKLPSHLDTLFPDAYRPPVDVPFKLPTRACYRVNVHELHARFELDDVGLLCTYVRSLEGQDHDWKVSDVRTRAEADGGEWFETLVAAAEDCGQKPRDDPLVPSIPKVEKQDDDDDYWAAYDGSLDSTPLASNAGPGASSSAALPSSQSEDDYYARYASEVQPALDLHDTYAPGDEAAQSPAHRNVFGYQQNVPNDSATDSLLSSDGQAVNLGANLGTAIPGRIGDVRQPHPPSALASHGSAPASCAVANGGFVSQTAEPASLDTLRPRMGSLFREARDAGMDRDELETLVREELDSI